MPFAYTINPYRGCAHACLYCLAGDTLVLLADGRQRRIADLRVGDRIVGTERQGGYRRYVETEVLAHWSTVKPAYRMRLEAGSEITASGDHRFLGHTGWRCISGEEGQPALAAGDELLGPGAADNDHSWNLGGPVESAPGLRASGIEPIGVEIPMYDITTGTGDFIANGVISHNCFARRTHEWLELDSGRDFDTQIVVKTNLVEVLQRELARPSWQREHVALGTNTDPYQRAEGRYRLMPGVIQALGTSGTPFSILTKGTLARRDIPLLVATARDVPLGLGVSMAIWNDELHSSLEPGVPTPRARLDLVRAYADAGLACGVFLAPVLPGLTDDEESLDAALAAIAGSGASGVTVIPLHLRPGARQWFFAWLERAHPELVPRYRRLYGRGAYVPKEYRTWLAARVAPLVARHGLHRQAGGQARRVTSGEGSGSAGVPGDEQAEFPTGSLPARSSDSPAQEQLTLY